MCFLLIMVDDKINIIALSLQTSEPHPLRGSRKISHQLKEAVSTAEDKSTTSGDVSVVNYLANISIFSFTVQLSRVWLFRKGISPEFVYPVTRNL